MRQFEDECIGCVSTGHHCRGEFCPLSRVLHLYCDECGADVDELYITDDGRELCETCLLESFERITL